MFPGKWLQTRTRDSRHEYVASPSPPPVFFIAFRAPLSYVYVRPILRDHVCVRAAAIQISPLGYTSLQTDTVRAVEMGGVNGFASSTLLPTRRLFKPLLEYIRISSSFHPSPYPSTCDPKQISEPFDFDVSSSPRLKKIEGGRIEISG